MAALDRNFVFVHVPKAGGTSITEMLFEFIDDVYPREKLFDYPHYADIDPPERPSLFISHFGYSFYRPAGGYCMTVLRDPVERVLSLFSYWKNPGDKRAPGDPLPDGMTIDEFLDSPRQDIWTNIRNAQTWQIAFGLDAATRHRLEGLKGFELFDIAKSNIDRMSVVGVIEQPQHFVAQIEYIFEDRQRANLEHYNQTAERTLTEDISPETIAKIQSMTDLDQRLYDHSRHLASQRFNSIIHSRIGKYLPTRT